MRSFNTLCEEWGLLSNKLLHKQTVDLLNKKSIDVYDDNPSWIFKTAVIFHKMHVFNI